VFIVKLTKLKLFSYIVGNESTKKRIIKMNKFILSILMSLTLIGVVNASVQIGDISGHNKVKKVENKDKVKKGTD